LADRFNSASTSRRSSLIQENKVEYDSTAAIVMAPPEDDPQEFDTISIIKTDRPDGDQSSRPVPCLATPTAPTMNDTQPPPTIGRLAPSPTGGLHLGHARTFLIAWLAARAARGRVVLRIEDLDVARVRADAFQGALNDLNWLGLDWDEGPYVQSERRAIYDEALGRLKAAERVYPCTCTRADIERAASAPHPEDEGPTYPGTCAGRRADDAWALGDKPFAWRFRVAPGPVAWDDVFLGRRALDPARLGGDFVVARNTFGPSYQLAVVVDDALMGVTQVVRGADLVPSTPRQVLLYDALGWPPPLFGHVPLVVDPDGRRLAKRDGSIKLAALRERGVDSERLIAALARSCGWTSAVGRLKPSDLIGDYAPESLSGDPWIMNPDDWLDDAA
jgi:glutamyl-tRNA synthetase